jgi:hypothetical protein
MLPCTPNPLDTSNIELPTSLDALLEQLAENTHDVWSAQRIADGSSYGPKCDDVNKKHPCLAYFADLPESEKEYDCNSAGEALKPVILLGYEIRLYEDVP